MGDFFTVASLVFVVGSGIRLATPFLLAGLGEAIGQRSGVLNLGVDGVMLLGAFGAYWTIYETQSPVLGVFVGLGVGLVALYLADLRLTRNGGAPVWWPKLRLPLTCGATVCLIVAALA